MSTSTPAASALPSPDFVLLVDDEPGVREIGAMMLQRLGWRVITAASGDEAVALLAERGAEFACVVTDLAMPQRDGLSVAEDVRRIAPALPLVLMSGLPDAGQRLRARGYEGVFLAKPFSAAQLAAAIAAAQTERLRAGSRRGAEGPSMRDS